MASFHRKKFVIGILKHVIPGYNSPRDYYSLDKIIAKHNIRALAISLEELH